MAPPASLTIRPARAADAVELTALAHAAKRHWGYPESMMALWRETLTVTPETIADDVCRCAVCDDAVVGFYAVSIAGRDAELEHMWVRPPEIGTGVGRRLFAHAVALLRERGVATLRIVADPHAEGFYLHMGARRAGDVASTPPGRRLPLLVFVP